jgi:hypothetical protein
MLDNAGLWIGLRVACVKKIGRAAYIHANCSPRHSEREYAVRLMRSHESGRHTP